VTVVARHEASGPKAEIRPLPPADLRRWTKRQKIAVVLGVRDGVIGLEEACARYCLSKEEFQSWHPLAEPANRRPEQARNSTGAAQSAALHD
jgi:hypothetical protein